MFSKTPRSKTDGDWWVASGPRRIWCRVDTLIGSEINNLSPKCPDTERCINHASSIPSCIRISASCTRARIQFSKNKSRALRECWRVRNWVAERGNEVRGIFSWPIKIFISYRLGNSAIIQSPSLLIFPHHLKIHSERICQAQATVLGRDLVKLRRTFVFCVSLLFVKKIYVLKREFIMLADAFKKRFLWRLFLCFCVKPLNFVCLFLYIFTPNSDKFAIYIFSIKRVNFYFL